MEMNDEEYIKQSQEIAECFRVIRQNEELRARSVEPLNLPENPEEWEIRNFLQIATHQLFEIALGIEPILDRIAKGERPDPELFFARCVFNENFNALRRALDSLPYAFENVKSGNIQSLIIDYHYSAIILPAIADIAFFENLLDKLFRSFEKSQDDENLESLIQMTKLYTQGSAMLIVQSIGKMGAYKEAIKNSPSNADIMREIQEVKGRNQEILDNLEPKEEELPRLVTQKELAAYLKNSECKMRDTINVLERKVREKEGRGLKMEGSGYVSKNFLEDLEKYRNEPELKNVRKSQDLYRKQNKTKKPAATPKKKRGPTRK